MVERCIQEKKSGSLKFDMAKSIPTQIMLIYDPNFGSRTINTGFHTISSAQINPTQQLEKTNKVNNQSVQSEINKQKKSICGVETIEKNGFCVPAEPSKTKQLTKERAEKIKKAIEKSKERYEKLKQKKAQIKKDSK